MPNAVKGETKLGEHTLVYSFNALCLLEEEKGEKIGVLLEQLEAGVGLLELRTFIWAGLQEKHPGTSLEDAGDVIQAVGIPTALAAIETAVTAAFAVEAKGKKPRPPRAAKGGTG